MAGSSAMILGKRLNMFSCSGLPRHRNLWVIMWCLVGGLEIADCLMMTQGEEMLHGNSWSLPGQSPSFYSRDGLEMAGHLSVTLGKLHSHCSVLYDTELFPVSRVQFRIKSWNGRLVFYDFGEETLHSNCSGFPRHRPFQVVKLYSEDRLVQQAILWWWGRLHSHSWGLLEKRSHSQQQLYSGDGFEIPGHLVMTLEGHIL